MFTGETAPDNGGVPGVWTTVGTQTVAMNAAAFAGIAASSGSSSGGTLAAVVVDNVRIVNHGPVANLGPAVDAGVALSGGGPWMLDATVADDGLPAPAVMTMQWLAVGGPGVPVFANGTSTDTAVTFPVSGRYGLRLTASDGQVMTFDDAVADVALPTPYDSWRLAQFGAEAGNPVVAGELADPDGDGVANLLEYAFATEPRRAGGAAVTAGEVDEGLLAVDYRINLDATDVVAAVQWSEDLGTWSDAPATVTVLGESGRVRTVRATVPADGVRRFLRVKVTR